MNKKLIAQETLQILESGQYSNVFKQVHFAVLTKNETILEYFKM